MSFPILTYALVALIAAGGGAVLGFAGFGSGLFMVPLLTLVVSPAVAVPTVIIVGITGTARLFFEVRRKANIRPVLGLAFPAILLLPAGVFGLKSLDGELLRRLVSGVVLALVFVLAKGMRFPRAERLRVLVPAGAISGLLTGIGGVGGPPAVLTFLSIGDPEEVTRANLIVYLATTGVGAVVILTATRVMTLESLELALPAIPSFFLGTWLGSKKFRAAAEGSYRKVTLAFLAVVALTGLLWPI